MAQDYVKFVREVAVLWMVAMTKAVPIMEAIGVASVLIKQSTTQLGDAVSVEESEKF